MYATDGNGFDGFWFEDVPTKVSPKSSPPIIITNSTHEVWTEARCGIQPGINVYYGENILRPIINIQDTSYLKVNACIARELSGFTYTSSNNEREISVPLKISWSLLAIKRVLVNPVNSRAMSALTFLLFKLNTLQKKPSNSESAEAIV